MSERELLERELIEMIESIRRDYLKQIQPYMDRLARVRSLRAEPSMLIALAEVNGNPNFSAERLKFLRGGE